MFLDKGMSWSDQCQDVKNRAYIWSRESCSAYEIFHLLSNCFSLVMLVLLFLFCALQLPVEIFLIPVLFFLTAALVHVVRVLFASRKLSGGELSDKDKGRRPEEIIDADESKRQYAIVFLAIAFCEIFLYLLGVGFGDSLCLIFLFYMSISCPFFVLASVYAGRYPKTSILLIIAGQPMTLYIILGVIVPPVTLVLDPLNFFNEIEKYFVANPGLPFFLFTPSLAPSILASLLVAPYFLKRAQSFSAMVGIAVFVVTAIFVCITEFPNSITDLVSVYNGSVISAAIGLATKSLLSSVAIFGGVATIRYNRAQNNARKMLESALADKRQNSTPTQNLVALKTHYLYNGGDIIHWGVIIEAEDPEC